MRTTVALLALFGLAAVQDARPTRSATALEMLTAAEKKWTEGETFSIEGSLLLKLPKREAPGRFQAAFGKDNAITVSVDLGSCGKLKAFRKGENLLIEGSLTLEMESENEFEPSVEGGCSSGIMSVEPDTGLRLRRALARMGFASLFDDVFAACQGDGPVISDCEFQADEKFGARPVKVIDYTVRADEGAEPVAQRVWIDPETHELLQRRSKAEFLPPLTESYKPRK